MREAWLAHIDHGLMGFHPLIYSLAEDVPVFCDSAETLKLALQQADPKQFKVLKRWMLWPEKDGFGYMVDRLFESQEGEIQPCALLSGTDIEKIADTAKGIRWAPGVFGASCDAATYDRLIHAVK